MGICISIKVENQIHPMQVTVSQICGLGGNDLGYIPLLVDEGYLLVDVNGGFTKLFVKK